MTFQRFYANPPKECNWPFILRHVENKPQPQSKHEIVDVKIMDLLDPPHEHSEEKLKEWSEIETSGWKVVPDCFDLKGEFGVECGFDTVSYSKHLLLKYYDGEPNLMPVLQGRSHDIKSLKDYIDYFKCFYTNPSLIGVSGSFCRDKDMDFVYRCLKLVKRNFPDAWIHAFALRLNHLKNVHPLIDSFDSSNWTRPRTSGKASARNKAERIEYFWDFINNIEKVTVHLNKEQRVLQCL